MKKAFTLAEVLITLGIIGVVAALTMPALMASYKRMVFKQQYKKLYSTLYQAYNKSVYDTGGATECYHTDVDTGIHGSWSSIASCKDFKEALEKNLKIGKICSTKAVQNGCLTANQYKGMDDLLLDSNPDATDAEKDNLQANCGGLSKNSILNSNLVYVLNDGSIVISFSANNVPISMLVDVNGKKGPNKWGHDLFKLSFAKERNNYKLFPQGCGIDSIEKGGISSRKMWQEMHK